MADDDKVREAILMRRRAFVTAALAGAGVAVAGCDSCNPEPCLSPPATSVCLTMAAMPSDAGVAKKDAAGDAGVDGGTADAGKPPRTGIPPRSCLTMLPAPSQDRPKKSPGK